MHHRTALLRTLADRIASLVDGDVLRVAVDGLDGAGKTVFADELASHLQSQPLSVVRASIDSFHNPRNARYRRGRRSPEGYFLDSFNLAKLKELLLDPLSPVGNGVCRTEYFNHVADEVVASVWRHIPGPAVLLFDGIFVHRNELISYWDFSIFLDVPRAEALRRCCKRDGFGSPEPDSPDNARYVLGQQLYFQRCNPKSRAAIVIDNEQILHPLVVRGSLSPDPGAA